MEEAKITNNELPKQDSTVRACATPDCTKQATMQCPTCIKLDLEPTYRIINSDNRNNFIRILFKLPLFL